MPEPRGARIAVFDLDRTITTIGTFTPFMIYAAWRLAPWRLVALPAAALLLVATRFRIITRKRLKQTMQRLLLSTQPRRRLEPVIADFTRWMLRHHVRSGAVSAIERERAAGSRLVLATASFDFYAESFARALGFDGCIATASLCLDDMLVPGLPGENCYGAEKLRRVEEGLGPGIPRPHIVFYSDDRSDLPCLLWADEGVVVNPKRRFARIARARGLPVVRW